MVHLISFKIFTMSSAPWGAAALRFRGDEKKKTPVRLSVAYRCVCPRSPDFSRSREIWPIFTVPRRNASGYWLEPINRAVNSRWRNRWWIPSRFRGSRNSAGDETGGVYRKIDPLVRNRNDLKETNAPADCTKTNQWNEFLWSHNKRILLRTFSYFLPLHRFYRASDTFSSESDKKNVRYYWKNI